MSRRKFAHKMMFDYYKTKLRIICSCGKHSSVFTNTDEKTAEEQGREWFESHHGIREIQPRVRVRE